MPKNHPGANRNVHIKENVPVGDQVADVCELPSGFFTGHTQQIEVLTGPDFLVGWASSKHSGGSAKEARKKCYDEMDAKIKEYNSKRPAQEGGLLNKEVTVINQQKLIVECPEFNNVKEQSKIALEVLDNTCTFIPCQDEPITDSFQIVQQQPNVPPPVSNEPLPAPTSNKNLADLQQAAVDFLEERLQQKEQKDFNRYKPLQNIHKVANQKIKEGAAKQVLGKRKFEEVKLRHKKIQKIDHLIEKSSGDTVTFHHKGTKVTLSKAQATEFVKQQRVQCENTFQEGVSNQFQGVSQAAMGQGIKSITKQVGAEITAAPAAVASELGSSLGHALVHCDQYDSVGDAVMDVGKSTAVNTAVHATKSIALEALKGAVKEVAPSLAKKIPGVSTIDVVCQLGVSLHDATSVSDAIDKLADTGANIGIECASSYVGGAIGQAVIPVPVVGTFVGGVIGGALGSGVIRLKDSVLSSEVNQDNEPPPVSNESPSGSNEPPPGSNESPPGSNEPPSGSNEPPSGSNEPPSGSNEPPSGSNEQSNASTANYLKKRLQRKEQRDFNRYKPLQNIHKVAKQKTKEGDAKQVFGKRKFVEADLRYKKIQKLDDLIKNSSGDTVTLHQKGTKVTLSKAKATELVNQQRVQFANTFQEGVSNQFQGAAQAAMGHSVKSATKQVGMQLNAAPTALASGMGGSLGHALVHYDQYDSVRDAVMEAGKSTLVNTTVHAGKSIALAGVKGAVKELAPSVAKKIPVLSTIDTVYQVGSSVCGAKSVCDASDKLANIGIGYASSYVGGAIGQAVIPVPIVGAFVGSFIGGALGSEVIILKDKVIDKVTDTLIDTLIDVVENVNKYNKHNNHNEYTKHNNHINHNNNHDTTTTTLHHNNRTTTRPQQSH
jgi:hypothetical protein